MTAPLAAFEEELSHCLVCCFYFRSTRANHPSIHFHLTYRSYHSHCSSSKCQFTTCSQVFSKSENLNVFRYNNLLLLFT